MAIISKAIPTLLRGVSQSADSIKQSDHADIQENANSSPVQGLTKRSGTQFLASLSTSELTNVHVHTINRDTDERYQLILGDESINVYGLDGTAYTTANSKITTPDGVSYLDSSNPRSDFKTVTIADYTFIVNTSKTVEMNTAVSTGTDTWAIVFFNQVTASTNYEVFVDSATSIYNSGTTNLSTDTIAIDIKNDLDAALTGFTIVRNGPVLWLRKSDGSDFSITAQDSQGDTQITVVKNSVQTFSDLPRISPNNFVVEVKGDDTTNFDNYYVKFVTSNGETFGEGQWEETLKAGITYKIDEATMPHVLIRKADGNFIFAKADGGSYTANSTTYYLPTWKDRTVGDLDTAPSPSFIGTTINNVIFFRNRLGFLADDNIILSRVSEFFNFFPETVTTVVDSDPIDAAASNTKVSILKHAVTMGEQLILFSDQTQFVLSSSSDALTPKTANVVVATEFESSTAASPVGSGRSIYYLTKKGSFAGVREYITQEDVAIKDAADITIHIPKYIPSNIFKLAVSTSEDVLVLLGSDNQNKLYINRWLYGDNFNKVLNSWFTFTFNSNRKILGASFIDTDLYLIIATGSGTSLEKMPFESSYREANTDFEYHLDHKVTEATSGVSVAFNSSSNITTWTLPYKTYGTMAVIGRYLAANETSTYVSAANQSATNLKPGQSIVATTTNTNGSTNTITATGDYRLSKVIIGEQFEMHYRFSQQRLTDGSAARTNGSEYIGGRLQIHHFYVKYEDTGSFKVEVTPENRSTSTYDFTGKILGSSSIGNASLETGTFRFPVLSRADRVNVDIKNDTFLPTQLASAEFEARFHSRARRAATRF